MFEIKLFGKSVIGIGKSFNQLLSTDFDSYFGRTSDGVPTSKSKREALKSNRGWVHSAVQLIANRVSTAELQLYYMRGEEEVPIVNHPFLDLWNNPNPIWSGGMLRHLIQRHLDLCGEGYILKIRNGLGVPTELWPLPPSDMTIKYVRGEYIFEMQTNSGKFTYPMDDVIYLRYPKANDPMRGESPLQAKNVQYDVGYEIDKYHYTLFKRGGFFHYALTTDQNVTGKQANDIREAWASKLNTLESKFKPPVLPKGLKVTQLQGSALDLGTKDISADVRDQLLAGYGVPKALLGMMEGIMRANLEGAELTFALGSIEPRLKTWADGIIPTLQAMDKRIKARFKSTVPKDKEARRQDVEMMARNGLMSVEEARQMMGLKPEFKKGDTVLVPFNMVPVPKAVKALPKSKGWTVEQKDAIWERFRRETEARERRWMPSIGKWVDKIERDALKLMRDTFKAQTGKYAGWSAPKILADDKAPTPDVVHYEEMIIPLAGKLHKMDFKEAGESAISVLGFAEAFDLERPEVIQYLGTKTADFAKGQALRLAGDIKTILQQGWIDGSTIDELTQSISDKFTFERANHAATIARTEVISGSNRATRTAYKQLGVQKKTWLSARDGDVRDTHVEADARYSANPIGIDEDFQVGRASGQEPGNMGAPEEDINCRCSMLAEQEE